MRKLRVLTLALIAALGITAVAAAQTNEYTVSGKMARGGSKAKPKAVALSFSFQTTAAGGVQPAPIKEYSIGFEGTQVNTSVVPSCTATKSLANKCPAKSKIGSGQIQSKVGKTGAPLAGDPATGIGPASDCNLGLTLYNGGNNKALLRLSGSPSDPVNKCIVTTEDVIVATFKRKGTTTALVFTVPEKLRHQLGLDIAVSSTTSKINRITGRKAGRTRGYFESIGCSDNKRDLTVTFKDETNRSVPVKKSLGAC